MTTTKTQAVARKKALAELTRGVHAIGLFLFLLSGVISILALTGSFYMLQVYDRALGSGSIPTLLTLSGLAIGLYFFQGIFDVLRSQVLVRFGARLDARIAPMAHQVAIDMPRFGFSTSEALERGRDVDTVRGFLGSQGPVALFDLPWMPVFLVFVYALHPLLGALTLGGMVMLTCLALLTEVLTRRLAKETHESVINRNRIADSNARNSEVLRAMGMSRRVIARFTAANADHLSLHTRTNDISGTLGALSKVLRMIMQSAVLGLGAFLTIQGELSGGAIIAASVASARALAPIDMAIGNWKQVVAARTAYGRLKDTVTTLAGMTTPLRLPRPTQQLSVESVTVAAPDTGTVLLGDITFTLHAGQALGVIGPSGGGKTTLVRVLTGIWDPLRGAIRLDGANLAQYDEEALGSYIGYMPQDVALMDGTIAENICRFTDNVDPDAIVAAATAAGVHQMIVRMPDGYNTRLGAAGHALSGGQRQRIGLARALFGDPFLVVLDEPNSNLDSEGEAALTTAISGVTARGGIVVVIAHRPSALASVDTIAVIQSGKSTAIGRKEDILGPKPAATVHPAPAPSDQPAIKRPLRLDQSARVTT
ncbi:ATP-binding cassette, subfamily C [Loktanella atrilutea]|uniref:ATP-binding cassette, subfamily C n=1 Tax=Loktanella atrilutea TaxID=366533 RepID=A0A1M5FBM0_LOKAT|nr:type I secretion system permease/ATPase [Loktanella atrilutea]SHF88993.1 ATP-binding cassette, subfamily C [Loktanella atrilutea]